MAPHPPRDSPLAQRAVVLGLAKVVLLALGRLSLVQAAPVSLFPVVFVAEKEGQDTDDPSLWLYLGVAAALVLLGGAFAGLTIALMGQDEVYLQVIRDSGEGGEKKQAAKVLKLLQKGKHWVLVTLLLSNVITNETLPIVLDRSLGGGWPAVLGSTVLIVIFGEIAPQSVCVRYGLPIGSWMAPFVLVLMYVLAPVAWPTAKLLDYLLGEDHGTVYKKAGLKTLVSLHKTMGEASQQLNTDEVTIITAVLDLKDKPVGSIMTPMEDVFTLSLDDVLDEITMDNILSQGYSRIPIHHPDNDTNFVGMLLVKILITYDPEDAKPVRDFALATLPETRPETSCLDIVNFFQEGKSHMVLVSEYPGDDHGALGVVTLEDVIEELIGEEIVDESDVFVDVHKAIRRAMPAPRARIAKGGFIGDPPTANGAVADLINIDESETLSPEDLHRAQTLDGVAQRPKGPATTTRRRSSATISVTGDGKFPKKANSDEIREHLKHIGPSNLASRPRSTRYNAVKIKPGTETVPPQQNDDDAHITPLRKISEPASEFKTGIGEGLLKSGGKEASDGVQTLQQGYGTISVPPTGRRSASVTKAVQADPSERMAPNSLVDSQHDEHDDEVPELQRPATRNHSESTLGSLQDAYPRPKSPFYQSKGPARSGSITENIVDANGIRKVVLETTSSSESNEEEDNSGANKGIAHHDSGPPGGHDEPNAQRRPGGDGDHRHQHDDSSTKKKRRRRRKRGPGKGEQEPLLGDHR